MEELSINLRGSEEYCPPQRLYSCPSIQKLPLISCQLEISEMVKWDQLKSLTIQCVHSMREEAINYVVAGSPLLEIFLNLRIKTWRGEDLNIQSNSLTVR